MASPFGEGVPDDAVPTRTSVQQQEAEDACRPLFEELLDADGVINRESCVRARPLASRPLVVRARAIPLPHHTHMWHDTHMPIALTASDVMCAAESHSIVPSTLHT